MKVEILKGKELAIDKQKNIYNIKGIEIKKENGRKVVYEIDSPFYKACAAEGIICDAYLLGEGNIMLT